MGPAPVTAQSLKGFAREKTQVINIVILNEVKNLSSLFASYYVNYFMKIRKCPFAQ